MAQLCPHCKQSTQFKVTLTAEGIVELKNDTFELTSQGELGIQDGTLICAGCNTPVANNDLVAALECSDCHTFTPVENMVQLQNDDGSAGAIICTGCYEKMSAPSPADMSKEELLELNNNKDTQMSEMQLQMQQMMAQMQQMQAQLATSGGTTQTVPQTATPNVQQNPPVQEPSVATNLPMPNAVNEAVNVIDPGTVQPEENVVSSFFGGEAPF